MKFLSRNPFSLNPFSPNPTLVAQREQQELDLHMLTYTAELLRIEQQVGYIKKRQEQLKAMLEKGFCSNSTLPPSPQPLHFAASNIT